MSNLLAFAIILSVVFALTGLFVYVMLKDADNTADWPSLSDYTTSTTEPAAERDPVDDRDENTGGTTEESDWVFDK